MTNGIEAASRLENGLDPLVVEYDTREGMIARRNVLLGLWTANRLGLSGEAAEAYAWSVHLSDSEKPGQDDIVQKIVTDLAAANLTMSARDVRSYLHEMERRAYLQLAFEPQLTSQLSKSS